MCNSLPITNQVGESFQLSVGDWVGFKYDTEQYGKVAEFTRNHAGVLCVVVENHNGFYYGDDQVGEPVGETFHYYVEADRCWKES